MNNACMDAHATQVLSQLLMPAQLQSAQGDKADPGVLQTSCKPVDSRLLGSVQLR